MNAVLFGAYCMRNTAPSQSRGPADDLDKAFRAIRQYEVFCVSALREAQREPNGSQEKRGSSPFLEAMPRVVGLECCEVEAILQSRYEAAGAELFFYSFGESLGCFGLTMSHENGLGRRLRGANPSNELLLVGVC